MGGGGGECIVTIKLVNADLLKFAQFSGRDKTGAARNEVWDFHCVTKAEDVGS